jgi:hypothetical protein
MSHLGVVGVIVVVVGFVVVVGEVDCSVVVFAARPHASSEAAVILR